MRLNNTTEENTFHLKRQTTDIVGLNRSRDDSSGLVVAANAQRWRQPRPLPFFLPSRLPLSYVPFISSKVSRWSEAACHRSFVYSDKIAAFIACQINLKKRERRRRWRCRRGIDEMVKSKRKRNGGGKKKPKIKQRPYHAVVKPSPRLFLSACDKFKLSLLSPSLLFFSPHLIYGLSAASLAILE